MEAQSAFANAFLPALQPVPDGFGTVFAPATYIAHEWREYFVEFRGADRLHLGSVVLPPVRAGLGLFRLRFENQLGLTTIRPYAGATPLAAPLHVEVISPKFQEPGAHLGFLRTLVNDLFARAARLPFTIVAETSRGVNESLQPPSPLFTLHFLCQHGVMLRQALATVLATPHRVLAAYPDQVPLAAAAEVDPDVILRMLQAPEELVPARGLAIARRLRGHAPQRVWQRMPEESSDTPENRFVLAFVRAALAAAEALPTQAWWQNVPTTRQHLIREVVAALRQALTHPVFDGVGQLTSLPAGSQVLMRREGYRELRSLWQLFQQARRPLFEPMRHAIELRDIATLYEVWCFFALAEEIATLTGEAPALELRLNDAQGLGWSAAARFGRGQELLYNAYGRSYSVPLRPDFTWRSRGSETVVLDAKFRMERGQLEPEASKTAQTSAKRDDIYKMHTYRDALAVRSAVIVYPGDLAVFYDCQSGRQEDVTLHRVLFGDLAGVGALPLRPMVEVEARP